MHNEARQYMEVVGGLRTHFVVAGEGEPLLLIHGLGVSTLAWHYNIEPLSRHFKVYVLDLPGHGYSEKPYDKKVYTPTMAAWFLNEFCESQQLARVNVIGQSMGGALALEFALAYPERVDKAVVVCGAGLGREVYFGLRFMSLPFVAEILLRFKKSRIEKGWKLMFYDRNLIPQNLVEEDRRISNLPGNREALLAMMRAGLNFFGQRDRVILTNFLPSLRAETLFLAGRNDRIIPYWHSLHAAELVPGGKVHIFEQCGHCPPIEKLDEFNDVVIRFLQEEP